MHSLEHIRDMNDLKAIRGARVKLVGMTLVNTATNEVACSRTFADVSTARAYCAKVGAIFAGVSKRKTLS